MEENKDTLDLGFAKLDLQRQARCGFPEVVYCAGKTTDQSVRILEILMENMTMSSVRGLRKKFLTSYRLSFRLPNTTSWPRWSISTRIRPSSTATASFPSLRPVPAIFLSLKKRHLRQKSWEIKWNEFTTSALPASTACWHESTISESQCQHRRCRHGRGSGQCRRRFSRQTGYRGTDQYRIRCQFPRPFSPSGYAQQLRGRDIRRQHRQWLRRRQTGRYDEQSEVSRWKLYGNWKPISTI